MRHAFEEEAPSKRKIAKVPLTKRLHQCNAWSATAMFLTCLVAEFICVILMVIIAFFRLQAQGSYSPGNLESALDTVMQQMYVLIPVSTGIATVLVARALIPSSLKDTSSTGAAWVRGDWVAIIQGLVVGVILGAGIYTMSKALRVHVEYKHIGPLGRMAATPGLLRILSAVIVMLLAPFTEEILFRGVLYGGYRKSFGASWSAVLTTLLFFSLHLPRAIYYVAAFVGILLLSLATLAARLWSSAVGPAIAVHVGYNSMLFVLDVFRQ
jgi:membrane protease YdiL (CAAX protease family)